jgi:type II secretory pathway pseudopilin PulG
MQGGFTYLWVLFLVAFLGFGMTLVVESEVTATQRDKEKELLALGRQFRIAIGRYYEVQLQGGMHSYPASLDDLLLDGRSPGVRRHLRKIFIDPMTGKPEWGLVKIGGFIVGVYSLSGGTPIKQDGFDVEESLFRGKQKYSEWKFTYLADPLLNPDGTIVAPSGLSGGTVAPVETKTFSPAFSGAQVGEQPKGISSPFSRTPGTGLRAPNP